MAAIRAHHPAHHAGRRGNVSHRTTDVYQATCNHKAIVIQRSVRGHITRKFATTVMAAMRFHKIVEGAKVTKGTEWTLTNSSSHTIHALHAPSHQWPLDLLVLLEIIVIVAAMYT